MLFGSRCIPRTGCAYKRGTLARTCVGLCVLKVWNTLFASRGELELQPFSYASVTNYKLTEKVHGDISGLDLRTMGMCDKEDRLGLWKRRTLPPPRYFGGFISHTAWRMGVKNSWNNEMNIKELLVLTNENLGVALKVHFGFFRRTLERNSLVDT